MTAHMISATLLTVLFLMDAATANESPREAATLCNHVKRVTLPGKERHELVVSVRGVSCSDAVLDVAISSASERLFSYRAPLSEVAFLPPDEGNARLNAEQVFASSGFEVVESYPREGTSMVDARALRELDANELKVVVFFQDSPLGMSYAAYNPSAGRWMRYLSVEVP